MTKEIKRIKINQNKKKAQIARRRKFFVSLLSFVCVVGIITGITTISAKEGYETRVITVESGDTLWDLVSQHCGEGDIRKTISKVKKMNNMEGSNLTIGESILIPIYG